MVTSKISIIVPVYNVPVSYLKKCISSLISQTYKNIEIILVDDGSTDNSGSICDLYAAEDQRIRVIHKENGGLVSSRNAGFEVATGSWIMYVDGDDWIESHTCQELLEKANAFADIDVICWKYCVDINGKIGNRKSVFLCDEEYRLYQNEECKDLALNTLNYTSGIATAYCKLIRADYAKKNNLLHDRRLRQGAEGVEFSLRVFYNAKKVLYINKTLYHYIFNPTSISKKIDEKNTHYLVECFNVISQDIDQFTEKEKFKSLFYQRIAYVLIAIAMNTYFHPNNNDSIFLKIQKYNDVINTNIIFKEALHKSTMKGMDFNRKVVLLFIRMKMYFLLHIVAKVKQNRLKKGKFNF